MDNSFESRVSAVGVLLNNSSAPARGPRARGKGRGKGRGFPRFASKPKPRKLPRLDLGSCRPVADIHHINWDQACGYGRSAAGASGVFFAQFPDQGTVVVKGSKAPAATLFCTMVAHSLGGVFESAPEVRLVACCNSGEWSELKHTLRTMASNTEMGPAIIEESRVSAELDRPVLLLMQFVPGVSSHALELVAHVAPLNRCTAGESDAALWISACGATGY